MGKHKDRTDKAGKKVGGSKDKCKTLCDWKKDDIEESFDDLLSIVGQPAYVCRKCARVAGRPDCLCKPVPLYANRKE